MKTTNKLLTLLTLTFALTGCAGGAVNAGDVMDARYSSVNFDDRIAACEDREKNYGVVTGALDTVNYVYNGVKFAVVGATGGVVGLGYGVANSIGSEKTFDEGFDEGFGNTVDTFSSDSEYVNDEIVIGQSARCQKILEAATAIEYSGGGAKENS